MIAPKEKKVIFSVADNQKAKFKVQLQYDSLTQGQFLKGVMEAYINQDENLMKFVATLKKQLQVQSQIPRKKAIKNIEERKSTINKFALEDNEVENIFDILEQEYPEL